MERSHVCTIIYTWILFLMVSICIIRGENDPELYNDVTHRLHSWN